jgi:hypothetical protein
VVVREKAVEAVPARVAVALKKRRRVKRRAMW